MVLAVVVRQALTSHPEAGSAATFLQAQERGFVPADGLQQFRGARLQRPRRGGDGLERARFDAVARQLFDLRGKDRIASARNGASEVQQSRFIEPQVMDSMHQNNATSAHLLWEKPAAAGLPRDGLSGDGQGDELFDDVVPRLRAGEREEEALCA